MKQHPNAQLPLLSHRSNAHYVGYVEENESIEAIMKKFEELARMEEEFAKSAGAASSSASAPSPAAAEGASSSSTAMEGTTDTESGSVLLDGGGELVLGVEKVTQGSEERQGFTDEQLQEIFRRTSGFTVRSMLRDTPEDIYEEDHWQANIADEDYLHDFEEEEYVWTFE